MPLLFQPRQKSIVMCDFSGFVVPEMVKMRPVVVLAKHKHNSQLVTIVPLSTTEPDEIAAHHHEISVCPFPDKPKATRMWAKCDMVYTVSLHRLDRYKMKIPNGRKYIVPALADNDFLSIKRAVIVALGL